MLAQAERRLGEAGLQIRAVGLFTTAGPAWVAAAIAGVAGAAAGLGGGGKAVGAAAERVGQAVRRLSPAGEQLPHRVLVAVTRDDVRVIESDRWATVGSELRRWGAGRFIGRIDRYPFEIDLVVEPHGEERIIFKTNRGPLHRRTVRAARQVVNLGED